MKLNKNGDTREGSYYTDSNGKFLRYATWDERIEYDSSEKESKKQASFKRIMILSVIGIVILLGVYLFTK